MLLPDFTNRLTHTIRDTGANYMPHSGYDFKAIPTPVIQILAGPEYDLIPGTEIKDKAGRSYFIAEQRVILGAIYLVTLIPQD